LLVDAAIDDPQLGIASGAIAKVTARWPAGTNWSEARLLAIARAMTPLTGGFSRPPSY